MNTQTRPTQVFTVFGSLVLEGDYFPTNRTQTNWQDLCDSAQTAGPRQPQSIITSQPWPVAA